jgi:hypothetical protein
MLAKLLRPYPAKDMLARAGSLDYDAGRPPTSGLQGAVSAGGRPNADEALALQGAARQGICWMWARGNRRLGEGPVGGTVPAGRRTLPKESTS